MLRRRATAFCLAMALFILMTPTVFAQSQDILSDIITIKHSIITIQELEQQGLITHAEGEQSIIYYTTQASKEVGHALTPQEILAMPDPAAQRLTPLQEFVGAIDFLRIMLVLGIIAVVGSAIYLFRYYVAKLIQLFKNVPVIVYEILFFAVNLGRGIGGWLLPEPMHGSLGLLGCLLFAGALG